MTALTVTARNLRISPRKLRLFGDLLKDSSIEQATTSLTILGKKGAHLLVKVLKNIKDAAAAKNLDKSKLRITAFQVQDGHRLKRWMPAARGRTTKITKRMSHVVVTVSDASPIRDNSRPDLRLIRKVNHHGSKS